jgi:DNA-binding transcriptional regulator YhcF (GntR family)
MFHVKQRAAAARTRRNQPASLLHIPDSRTKTIAHPRHARSRCAAPAAGFRFVRLRFRLLLSAMRLWFAHRTEVSLREQLVTQVILAIQGCDLAPGDRLPSTREIARRFRIHQNTVSAGYRQLQRDGWVEFRRGSGVYVAQSKPDTARAATLSPSVALDQLIAQLFRSARTIGASQSAVRARLRHWLELQPPDHFLVIESDEELGRIAAAEIEKAVAFPVRSCGWKDSRLKQEIEGAIPVVLPRKAAIPSGAVPPGIEVVTLQVRSVNASLAEWIPAPSAALVAVASRWPDFLNLARTLLLAAGFSPDSLLFRDARKPHWQRGLKQAAAVVCDTVTAASLPKGVRPLVFPLLSESSLEELRTMQDSLQNPLDGPAKAKPNSKSMSRPVSEL